MEIEVRNTLRESNIGKIWHKKNNRFYYHREDGPAVIFDNGYEQWWYYNKWYEFPRKMPLNLFLVYCRWEYKKEKNNGQ